MSSKKKKRPLKSAPHPATAAPSTPTEAVKTGAPPYAVSSPVVSTAPGQAAVATAVATAPSTATEVAMAPSLDKEKASQASLKRDARGPSAPMGPSDRFWMGALVVLIVGIMLRQIDLGSAPFHPDEAIHAWFSQNFKTYQYNPVYHGPLLYHLTSILFTIFGQYDYTARLMPSLMGIILLVMVLFPARQWLGTRGALASGGLIALSTSVVTYSRHLLHDALALVLTLGAVLCFAGMWTRPANTSPGRYARLGLAAFLTLFLATKANCFFIFVMLLAFYGAWRGAGLLRGYAKLGRWVPPLALACVSFGAMAFPIAFDKIGTPEIVKNPQHTVFQVFAVVTCGWVWVWLLTRTPEVQEEEDKRNWFSHSDAITYILFLAVVIWIYVFLFGQGAQIIGQWFETKTFPTETYKNGCKLAVSGIQDMLKYWGGQQGTPRLPGQHDYYIILSLLYEVPILLAALGGLWYYAQPKNRSAWTDLLMWWGFTSWAVYAVANEKVPWLLVHIMLPFALLGGMWLGQIRWKRPVLVVAVALGAIFSLRGDIGMIFQRAGDNAEPILYAQTPDEFRDAIQDGIRLSYGRKGDLGMANDKQWPAVWYYRPNTKGCNPFVGESHQAIGGMVDLNNLRVMVGQPANEDQDKPDPARPTINPKEEEAMQKAGWDVKTVGFLIWPRVRWGGIRPDRYWHWWWTRDTLPLSERDLPQDEWKVSILAGDGDRSTKLGQWVRDRTNGEWSRAKAVIGYAH